MRLLLLLLSFSLISCTRQRIVSEQELNQYILDPENGLSKHQVKNGVDVEVIYRPSDLIAAQQLRGVSNKSERARIIQNFDSLSYFIVKLSRDGQEVENAYIGSEKFGAVLSYLSSGISRNIYLVNAGDTIPALDAVYARMFGTATATSIMTVFPSNWQQQTGRFTFLFDDRELGLGRSELQFEMSDIHNTPILNLE